MTRRRLRLPAVALALGLGLGLGLGGAGGCVEDDETVTCTNFDDFLYECYYNCARTFDCEERYPLLDKVSQQLLLECSDHLQQQALEEDCSDYFVQGWSCKALMVDLLQGECDW